MRAIATDRYLCCVRPKIEWECVSGLEVDGRRREGKGEGKVRGKEEWNRSWLKGWMKRKKEKKGRVRSAERFQICFFVGLSPL